MAGGAVALAALGWLMALVELLMASVGTAALLGAGMAYVWLVRPRVDAVRTIRPDRVHAGTPSQAVLTVRNVGARRCPLVAASDPFDGGRRWARFQVAPLAPGESRVSSYGLPTTERGIYQLGPLELGLSDPLGLAVKALPGAPAARLVVYPRVEPIPPLPPGSGDDRRAAARPAPVAAPDAELYGLREYEVGDDLRRVHWLSTAKVGQLMIRQDELPWKGAATVVLDLRAEAHTAETLEVAVVAAASVADACRRWSWPVRLVTTDGLDSELDSGREHVEAILEHLAAAGPGGGPPPTSVLATLGAGGADRTAVMVTTDAVPDADLEQSARLGRGPGVILVVVERGAEDRPARSSTTSPVVGGAPVVRVRPGESLASAWARAGPGRPHGRGTW